MSGQDKEGAIAHHVARRAEYNKAAHGVVRYFAVVLLVFGVAEEHDALDLLADGGAAVPDGGGREGCALAERDQVWSAFGTIRRIRHAAVPKLEDAYLYPPATTFAVGHLELARLRRFFISAIAAAVVPSGSKLSSRSAS